jgi:hypothetical protein
VSGPHGADGAAIRDASGRVCSESGQHVDGLQWAAAMPGGGRQRKRDIKHVKAAVPILADQNSDSISTFTRFSQTIICENRPPCTGSTTQFRWFEVLKKRSRFVFLRMMVVYEIRETQKSPLTCFIFRFLCRPLGASSAALDAAGPHLLARQADEVQLSIAMGMVGLDCDQAAN